MIYPFLLPHNPLMISKIGQEHSQQLSSSIQAIKLVRQEIYNINPEKIFIITPSINNLKNLTINQSEKYSVNFKSFGELSLQFDSAGDLDYSTKLRNFLRKNNFDVNLFLNPIPNYSSFVPLYYLNKYHIYSQGFEDKMPHDSNSENEFIIINSSLRGLNYHQKFGMLFADFLMDKKKNIVIIACGDLLGITKKKNDKHLSLANQIINFLQRGDYEKMMDFLLSQDEEMKNTFYPVLYPLSTITPLLLKSHFTPNVLSLDKKFGGMFVTIEFKNTK